MLVKDVMTPEPVTISPTAGVLAARTKLAYVGITSMPVVNDDGRLCGIVSEADLIEHIPDDPRAHERPLTIRPVTRARTVADVYTRTPFTSGRTTTSTRPWTSWLPRASRASRSWTMSTDWSA